MSVGVSADRTESSWVGKAWVAEGVTRVMEGVDHLRMSSAHVGLGAAGFGGSRLTTARTRMAMRTSPRTAPTRCMA